jgi:two-component system NtrC family sensor kinase
MNRNPNKIGDPGAGEPGNQVRGAGKELHALVGEAMVGRITPEVIHDINNQLTGILGYAELLLMKRVEDPGIKNGLKNILLAAEKSKGLLDNLLVLAHQESSLSSLNNVNLLLSKTLELRSCALRHRQIDYQLELATTMPTILLDGAKFHKTLLTLIMKAEENLENLEYGKILILKTMFDPQGNRITVTIRDNNSRILVDRKVSLPEMTGETFSTDLAIQLGLEDACRWIGTLGGSIKLENKKGEGTIFSISFPAEIPPEA